jgi:hypothetical protein
MKRSRLTGLLIAAALVFFLTSCGGGKKEKPAPETTTGTTPEVKTPVSTIVTTPENMLVVTHKVANYAKWIVAYEGHDSARLANGIHSYVIGRGLQDSNMVLVALKVDDMTKAKAFSKDPGLKQAMKNGGVLGAPSMSYYTATWQDTGMISSNLRARTMFSVKDWEAWQKGFADGKQERMDNGITDRVIGHDVDDSKKVTLVTAVTDTARAFAYYKSDALKKRREAGGVIGQPQRFLFRIVKKY